MRGGNGVDARQVGQPVEHRNKTARCRIGTEVHVALRPHCENPAIRVQRSLHPEDVVAPMIVTRERLGPVGDPLHRAAKPPGRFKTEDILWIEPVPVGSLMATMNVCRPDPMKSWVTAPARGGRYSDVSDYVRDLILGEQVRQDAVLQMQGLVDEALRSPTARAFDMAGFIEDGTQKR